MLSRRIALPFGHVVKSSEVAVHAETLAGKQTTISTWPSGLGGLRADPFSTLVMSKQFRLRY